MSATLVSQSDKLQRSKVLRRSGRLNRMHNGVNEIAAKPPVPLRVDQKLGARPWPRPRTFYLRQVIGERFPRRLENFLEAASAGFTAGEIGKAYPPVIPGLSPKKADIAIASHLFLLA